MQHCEANEQHTSKQVEYNKRKKEKNSQATQNNTDDVINEQNDGKQHDSLETSAGTPLVHWRVPKDGQSDKFAGFIGILHAKTNTSITHQPQKHQQKILQQEHSERVCAPMLEADCSNLPKKLSFSKNSLVRRLQFNSDEESSGISQPVLFESSTSQNNVCITSDNHDSKVAVSGRVSASNDFSKSTIATNNRNSKKKDTRIVTSVQSELKPQVCLNNIPRNPSTQEYVPEPISHSDTECLQNFPKLYCQKQTSQHTCFSEQIPMKRVFDFLIDCLNRVIYELVSACKGDCLRSDYAVSVFQAAIEQLNQGRRPNASTHNRVSARLQKLTRLTLSVRNRIAENARALQESKITSRRFNYDVSRNPNHTLPLHQSAIKFPLTAASTAYAARRLKANENISNTESLNSQTSSSGSLNEQACVEVRRPSSLMGLLGLTYVSQNNNSLSLAKSSRNSSDHYPISDAQVASRAHSVKNGMPFTNSDNAPEVMRNYTVLQNNQLSRSYCQHRSSSASVQSKLHKRTGSTPLSRARQASSSSAKKLQTKLVCSPDTDSRQLIDLPNKNEPIEIQEQVDEMDAVKLAYTSLSDTQISLESSVKPKSLQKSDSLKQDMHSSEVQHASAEEVLNMPHDVTDVYDDFAVNDVPDANGSENECDVMLTPSTEHLLRRLISPARRQKLSAAELLQSLEERHMKAEKLRIESIAKRQERLRANIHRLETISAKQAEAMAKKVELSEERLRNAAFQHEQHLENIRRKAENENLKAREINFIHEAAVEERRWQQAQWIQKMAENEARRKEHLEKRIQQAQSSRQEAVISKKRTLDEEKSVTHEHIDRRLEKAEARRAQIHKLVAEHRYMPVIADGGTPLVQHRNLSFSDMPTHEQKLTQSDSELHSIELDVVEDVVDDQSITSVDSGYWCTVCHLKLLSSQQVGMHADSMTHRLQMILDSRLNRNHVSSLAPVSVFTDDHVVIEKIDHHGSLVNESGAISQSPFEPIIPLHLEGSQRVNLLFRERTKASKHNKKTKARKLRQRLAHHNERSEAELFHNATDALIRMDKSLLKSTFTNLINLLQEFCNQNEISTSSLILLESAMATTGHQLVNAPSVPPEVLQSLMRLLASQPTNGSFTLLSKIIGTYPDVKDYAFRTLPIELLSVACSSMETTSQLRDPQDYLSTLFGILIDITATPAWITHPDTMRYIYVTKILHRIGHFFVINCDDNTAAAAMATANMAQHTVNDLSSNANNRYPMLELSMLQFTANVISWIPQYLRGLIPDSDRLSLSATRVFGSSHVGADFVSSMRDSSGAGAFYALLTAVRMSQSGSEAVAIAAVKVLRSICECDLSLFQELFEIHQPIALDISTILIDRGTCISDKKDSAYSNTVSQQLEWRNVLCSWIFLLGQACLLHASNQSAFLVVWQPELCIAQPKPSESTAADTTILKRLLSLPDEWYLDPSLRCVTLPALINIINDSPAAIALLPFSSLISDFQAQIRASLNSTDAVHTRTNTQPIDQFSQNSNADSIQPEIHSLIHSPTTGCAKDIINRKALPKKKSTQVGASNTAASIQRSGYPGLRTVAIRRQSICDSTAPKRGSRNSDSKPVPVPQLVRMSADLATKPFSPDVISDLRKILPASLFISSLPMSSTGFDAHLTQ